MDFDQRSRAVVMINPSILRMNTILRDRNNLILQGQKDLQPYMLLQLEEGEERAGFWECGKRSVKKMVFN